MVQKVCTCFIRVVQMSLEQMAYIFYILNQIIIACLVLMSDIFLNKVAYSSLLEKA